MMIQLSETVFIEIIFKNLLNIILIFIPMLTESLNIRKNISLKPYNTFGIDVKAKYFCEIRSEIHLKNILSFHEFSSYNKLIIGGGSNILLTKDFNGLVIKISIPGIEILHEDEENVLVKAGAGVI
ncbi:MAG: hypothetical protein EHM47_03245, partial [Ignavibacteriales bacterium]